MRPFARTAGRAVLKAASRMSSFSRSDVQVVKAIIKALAEKYETV